MKYMLLMYANESKAPENTAEVYQAWAAIREEAEAAGVLLSSNGLAPVADATTVRVRDGKTLTTDGPFAETHEQLGGYFLVECKDLDEAIAWAAKIPTAKYGSIEVRPLWSQK
jgi:hypothetical protein